MEPTPLYLRSWFIVFLLALLPGGMASRPVLDPDSWWHLRVGEFVLNHRDVPQTDPFSRVGIDESRPWVAYSWLYEITLAEFQRAMGLSGVIVFRILLDLSVFTCIAWLLLRRAKHQGIALLLLGLITYAMLPLMAERPWHFTILFTLLTIEAVAGLASGDALRKWLWLPLLYVLWANIHIQFVLGLGFLGLGLVAGIIDRFRGRQSPLLPLLILLVLCSLATLVNPYTWRVYPVVLEYATQKTPLRLVHELQPPDFSYTQHYVLVLLLILGAIGLHLRKYPTLETLLFLAGAVFSFRMQRDLWLGVFLSSMIVTRGNHLRPDISLKSLAVSASLGFLLMFALWQLDPEAEPIELAQVKHFPVAADEWVRENRPAGPIYNDFSWGGYHIWNLREYPVSMDGRTNLHGEIRLQRSWDTWSLREGWQTDEELLEAKLLIGPVKAPLVGELRKHADWEMVFEDETAVVFRRR